MLFAEVYQQLLDPFQGRFAGSAIFSTLLASLPVVVLFWLLVPMRWMAPKAGAAGSAVAIAIAVLAYGMPADKAMWSFFYGAGFGLLPVGWTIFHAMLLYNITVETGQFAIIRRSVASLSNDARIQAVLIGFSFGAFLEGAAGGGTPVAICAAIMVGLGFDPFLAGVLCLIANTSPVAYGGLGTPIVVLNGVTDIPGETISTMAAHQLPIISLFVPLYMVRCMCTWKQTWDVWPALLVSGGSFAVFQFIFARMHDFGGPSTFYLMTDIGGGIFSLVVTAVFLQFWKPQHPYTFGPTAGTTTSISAEPIKVDAHAAEAAALVQKHEPSIHDTIPLSAANVTLAWMPFVIMSVLLMASGYLRSLEKGTPIGPGRVEIAGGVTTNYGIPVPSLHNETRRDPKLLPPEKQEEVESAVFNFAWVTAPGSAVFLSALISMAMLRMSPRQIKKVLGRTIFQMQIPIPTIAFMLGLSYVTRYSGMDATLGYAFAGTGVLYPFFAPILGWLGVFLTGTDAGSNALFGSLQKITASEVYKTGAFTHLTEAQAQVLICTSNSTGGVMGKMIDAQSICVATAATHQIGREADIFKAVVWHSIFLAAIVGVMTIVQAYVYPFTTLVPTPPATAVKTLEQGR